MWENNEKNSECFAEVFRWKSSLESSSLFPCDFLYSPWLPRAAGGDRDRNIVMVEMSDQLLYTGQEVAARK